MYACVYSVHVYVCVCVFFFFLFWQQGLSLAWNSLIWLDSLATKAQGFSYVCLPSTVMKSECQHHFNGDAVFELRSLFLQGKHFTKPSALPHVS